MFDSTSIGSIIHFCRLIKSALTFSSFTLLISFVILLYITCVFSSSSIAKSKKDILRSFDISFHHDW